MTMKVILHDLDQQYEKMFSGRYDRVIPADGKYAPCQGCFGCWTKHPAECFMKDRLQQVCRIIGQADEFTIITKNLYGEYSAAVKNVLDRSIGTSTPLSTYRRCAMENTTSGKSLCMAKLRRRRRIPSAIWLSAMRSMTALNGLR